MVTLDLDCPLLDRAARGAVPLQILRDPVEVAPEPSDHRHRLAATSTLLSEDARDTVVWKLRAFRGRSLFTGRTAMIAAGGRVDKAVVRHDPIVTPSGATLVAMDVTSLGLRTDLALLERAGSTVEDRGDHLVVRTPRNPTFYWGNFFVLDHVPDSDAIAEWLERFVATLPGARHRAFAFDRPDGELGELAGFAEQGFSIDALTVMTARSVQLPPVPNAEATYRALSSDGDWEQSILLTLACHDRYEENHLEFVTLRVESNRALVSDGHGQWFGAFSDDRLVTQMGLITAGSGLARFQSVETHPEFRRRGLAGTLVHHVGQYGIAELDAETLVMVADPNDAAIRIYRTAGFTSSESELQAELAPGS